MRSVRLGITLVMLLLCGHGLAAQTLKATATAHSATLTWSASTTTGATYNVYRGAAAAGPFTVVGTTATTVLTYVDTSVTAGATYVYQVTAACASQCGASVVPNSESAPSNQVTLTIPNPQPPSPPTGLSGTVAVLHVGSQDTVTATWSDAPLVSTFYVMFNHTKNYIQMNGAPTPTAAGAYSISYTGSPFDGSVAICDANSACMILNFVG